MDGMSVIEGMPPIEFSPVAFAEPVTVTVGKAIDGMSDGILPVASMLRLVLKQGKSREMCKYKC